MSDNWKQGDLYERYVGRWSRQVAPRFVTWLGIPATRRWLDVGCGTGALCAAILDHGSPASVTGVEPSDGFRKTAAENLAGRATFLQGNAASIPLGDASVDVVVSALVLNCVPDPRAALAEMKRVTTPDGTIAAYIWDYTGRMDLMRYFWDAAVEISPDAASANESVRFKLVTAPGLASAFTAAGLRNVETGAIDIPTPFASFDEYWQPFLGGQGPAPAYAMSLDDATRTKLRDRLRAKLPTAADGSISLLARALTVRGTAS